MKRSGFLKRSKPLRKKRKGTSKHKAWTVFSLFIRRRDADVNGMAACISCGTVKHYTEGDCGHYVPKSVSLVLRFNETNNNFQCRSCNLFRHGNLTAYALALKKKYGDNILEELDEIRRNNQGFKISEADYEEIYNRYKGLTEG